MVLPGYWMDIGQPKDYLSGQTMFLKSQEELNPSVLKKGANIVGNVIIDESAEIDSSAVIGPNVVIGAGCKVGAGSKITNSTIMAGTVVKTSSYIDGSIIGANSTIGSWCRITNLAVIADDVQVKDTSYLNGTKVLPHKGVEGSHPNEGTIIM
jgi:mannose-1-phosphate guanylyltransferase